MSRVLVVDDVHEVRRRIADCLAGLDAEILQVANGAEAIEALDESELALIVSDVRMPRMDGLALLRAVRDRGVSVILHSGYQDVSAALEGLRLGAIDFLPAPLDFVRLRDQVGRHLERLAAAQDVILGSSEWARNARGLVERIADSAEPVLVTGETGVGKEVVARAIHAAGRRSRGPFVAVNVCALAPGTIESELFGHERGAFTGASARRIGRFEHAQGSTILLDEIGDAPPDAQARLLRVVETGQFERLGSSRPLVSDARVITATHHDLTQLVARGRFREDLWYRLSALRILVPPLRDRRQDIDDLARNELESISATREGPAFELDADGYRRLRAHPWPGNVRELLFTVRRMVVMAGERRLLDARDAEDAIALTRVVDDPRDASASAPTPGTRAQFADRERTETLEALNENRWNVSATARRLGISRGALRNRIRRHELEGCA